MDVSIIIVNYNTVNLIINAVDSIIEKTEGINYEIIIVDNNSTDNAEIILKERYNDKVKFIASPDNLGFGRANNLGYDHSTGKYLFLLNPDTLLINNAIGILFDYMEKHHDVGVAGGNLYDTEGNPNVSYAQIMPSILLELDVLFSGQLLKFRYGKNRVFNHSSDPMPVASISGADLMTTRKVWEEAKGFDPDFFMYYEETEWEYRIKKSGYQIISVPEAKIIHIEGQSHTLKENQLKMIFTGRKTFYQKVYSNSYTKCANFIFTFNCVLRICLHTLLAKKIRANQWRTLLTIFKKINNE